MASLLQSLKCVRYFSSTPRRAIRNYRQWPAAKINQRIHVTRIGETIRCCSTNVQLRPVEATDAQNNLDDLLKHLDVGVKQKQYASPNEMQKIITLLKEDKEFVIQPWHVLLMIRATGNFMNYLQPEDRQEMCSEIWDLLHQRGVPMDVSHYNALLRTYLENKQYNFDPLEFLTNMKNAGIEANKLTYQHLVNCCCEKGDIATATRLLELMKADDLPLNCTIFNSLIIGYSMAGDSVNAARIPVLMREAGLEPDGETYAVLMRMYAKVGDIDAILNILRTPETRELVCSSVQIMKLMRELIDNGQEESCIKLTDYLPSRVRCGIDEVDALSNILMVTQRGDIVKAILESFREMSTTCASTLIRFLIESKLSDKDITSLCTYIKRWLPDPYRLAVWNSYKRDTPELTIELLRLWRDMGAEIRPHYFLPIISVLGRQHDVKGIMKVTKMMSEEFQATPSIDAVVDYIIPYGFSMYKDPQEIAALLSELQIPALIVDNAVTAYLAASQRLRAAAFYVESKNSLLSDEAIRWPLVTRLSKIVDVPSFNAIFRKLWTQRSDCEEGKTRIVDGVIISNVSADDYLVQMLQLKDRNYDPRIVLNVAKYMKSIGCMPSEEVANSLSAYLAEAGLPSVDEYVDASENDVVNEKSDIVRRLTTVGFSELERCMAEKDTKQVLELIRGLVQAERGLSLVMRNKIVEYLCNKGEILEAKNFLEETAYMQGDTTCHMRFRVATAMVKQTSIKDAIAFLTKFPPRIHMSPDGFVNEQIMGFVTAVEEASGPEIVVESCQSLFSSLDLTKNQFLYLMYSLTKVHLTRNETEKALQYFEIMTRKEKVLLLRKTLVRQIITMNDTEMLQRYVNALDNVLGRWGAVARLVFDLIECERKESARKVLMRSGLLRSDQTLRKAVRQMVKNDEVTTLEALLDIVSGTPMANRTFIYDGLLRIYVHRNEWEKGLKLWAKMQEEAAIPSPAFLQVLAQLLRWNGQNVPFVYSTNDVPSAGASTRNQLER